ncbi:MAG: Bax inhibitor-1/YccA family protein, partial [Prevotellaceae bacterium]|nr:Bax inhibitor-1/YccA family protein [Prevotellaceae bacterium]
MKESIFEKAALSGYYTGAMTVKGSVIKTVLLVALTIFAASYTWYMVSGGANVAPWMWGGVIAGLVLALIISFVPKTAPYLSPLYAVAEGFALGAISALFEGIFSESYPGIVLTAVAITLLTTLIMLFCYQTGLIKVTDKLRSVIIIATISIGVFYLVVIVLNLFGVNTAFYHGASWLSIGISAVIVVIAALNLLLDFDFIEKGAKMSAPKYMEWYGAFG